MKKQTLISLTLTAVTWITSLAALALPPSATSAPTGAYPTYQNYLCSGFPQVQVSSTEDTCLGLVADKASGLKMPRYAVQAKDGTIYVSDMGSWDFNNGTIWAIELPSPNNNLKMVKMTNLFPKDKLTMPNGLLLDPEGRLYVGTPTGVYRFDPKNSDGSYNIDQDTETIEDGFMSSIFRKDEYSSREKYNTMAKATKNKHPLVQLAANKDFTEIYMNVGAPSDACTSGLKTKNDQGFCVQSESSLVNAGLWKTVLTSDSSRKKIKTEAVARGLRNSMGLAFHPITQKLYQAENSMDLKEAELPFEEINIIDLTQVRHYGWPYCHSNDKVNDSFVTVVKPEDCYKKYTGPLINMPAHTAPLGLLFYQSTRIPSLTNKLLVSWHGYREHGQKIVSYTLNEEGRPVSNKPELVVFNWAAKNGVRPQGAPVGLTELNDGRLLVMDDKNKSILILDSGENYNENNDQEKQLEITEEQILAVQKLQPLLETNCKLCHAQLAEKDSRKLIENLVNLTMVDTDEPEKSKLLIRVQRREMPMGPQLEESVYQNSVKDIKAFLDTMK